MAPAGPPRADAPDGRVRRIGILTGGGDCPGLNAVIRGMVRRGLASDGYSFLGFLHGWAGVLENQAGRPVYSKLLERDLNHPIEAIGKELRARMSWLQPQAAVAPKKAAKNGNGASKPASKSPKKVKA